MESTPSKRPSRKSVTIEQAEAFCAVARAGSYTSVAKARGGQITEVALMRLVGRFTAALRHDALLVSDRRGRVRLTPLGERVLPLAMAFVESARDLTALRPEIRFSAYPTIAGSLAQQCPDLLEHDIPLVLKNISEANRQDGGWRLAHDVASGRLDMAIAPSGLRVAGVTQRKVYSWRLRVLFPERERFAEKERESGLTDEERRIRDGMDELRDEESVSPAQIKDFRIAVAPVGHGSRELLRDAFTSEGLVLNPALESPNHELLRAVARGGRKYIAVMPDDAFGPISASKPGERAHEFKTAPYVRLSRSKRDFGGKYALYTRNPKEGGGGGESPASEIEHAIEKAAQRLLEAFSSAEG